MQTIGKIDMPKCPLLSSLTPGGLASRRRFHSSLARCNYSDRDCGLGTPYNRRQTTELLRYSRFPSCCPPFAVTARLLAPCLPTVSRGAMRITFMTEPKQQGPGPSPWFSRQIVLPSPLFTQPYYGKLNQSNAFLVGYSQKIVEAPD